MMRLTLTYLSAAALLAFIVTPRTRAAEPFRFTEATHKGGELKYIQGLPVLFLQGSPAEMGEQHAVLAAESARPLTEYPRRLLREHRLQVAWPVVAAASRGLLKNITPDHRLELEALVSKAGGELSDALHVGNAMLELRRLGGCSTYIVQPGRSRTGAPLFGRNLDLVPMGVLDQYSLLTVCRPQGKHAFVSIGYPCLVGVISGMNDAGLAVACLDVYASNDESPMFDGAGMPLTFCFRRLLEECSTVEEAERLMKTMKRTTWMNLAVCDKTRGVVFELTPKQVVVRQPENDVLACTNHFRSPELTVSKECWRFNRFDAIQNEKFDAQDVAAILHSVNQRSHTLQSMIFEPASLTLHVSLGKAPVTARPTTKLELAPLLKP